MSQSSCHVAAKVLLDISDLGVTQVGARCLLLWVVGMTYKAADTVFVVVHRALIDGCEVVGYGHWRWFLVNSVNSINKKLLQYSRWLLNECVLGYNWVVPMATRWLLR